MIERLQYPVSADSTVHLKQHNFKGRFSPEKRESCCDENKSPRKKSKQNDENQPPTTNSVNSSRSRRPRLSRVFGEANLNETVKSTKTKLEATPTKSIEKIHDRPNKNDEIISSHTRASSRRRLSKFEIVDILIDEECNLKDSSLYAAESDDDFEDTKPKRSQTRNKAVLNTPKGKGIVAKKSKSTMKKRYICSKCEETFYFKTQLTDHVKALHKPEEKPKPEVKTPSRKPAKMTATTPKSTKAKKQFDTPLIMSRMKPIKDPETPLEKARTRLHVSAVPDSLPCREEEFQQIYSFIEGKLVDGTGGCMFVSGVPGTGKTATVREVVRLLSECQEEGELPTFKFIEMNGMKLTEPHQLWVHVWKELTGQKVTAVHASNLLQNRFSSNSARRSSTLLLVDELDMLWTRKQDVMYNLFDWPTRSNSKLIVVAIANTMDLPERVMMNRVSSRLGLTRLTFQPYTYNQLETIVFSRLQGIQGFDPDGIQLVSRKVAALSGDARRALDICRRATEIAESNSVKFSPTKSPSKQRMLVHVMHVNQAIQEMFMSPKIMAIRSCSTFQKYLLQGIVAEFIRTGVEEACLLRVIEQFESICRLEGDYVPCNSKIMFMLNHLSSQRIVFCQHGRTDLHMRVRLNISTDDVNYAIKSST